MRIKAMVNFSQEVDVEIDAQDIAAVMAEALSPPDGKKNFELLASALGCFNKIHTFLMAISDDQIASLNDAQRKTIGTFLGEQAARYRPEGAKS